YRTAGFRLGGAAQAVIAVVGQRLGDAVALRAVAARLSDRQWFAINVADGGLGDAGRRLYFEHRAVGRLVEYLVGIDGDVALGVGHLFARTRQIGRAGGQRAQFRILLGLRQSTQRVVSGVRTAGDRCQCGAAGH
ncbi:hypothetical protein BU082_13160, partial [Staphylococcus warneri]